MLPATLGKSKLALIGASVVILIFLSFTPSAAWGDTAFIDRNVFASAVAGDSTTLQNWDSFASGTILTTDGGITYLPSNPNDQAMVTNSYLPSSIPNTLGAAQLGYFGNTETMTFLFADPINIFGVNINTFANGADYQLTTDTASTAVSGFDPFPGYTTGEFVGLIADTPFSSVTITPDGNGDTTYTLDDMTYGTSTAYGSVPEPSTLTLFGAVLFALGTISRRKSA